MEAMMKEWSDEPKQVAGAEPPPDLNTPKRLGNNRPHRSKAKRTQERKASKASKKRNR
jgi:hypothetical protein